jgi:hypothetical protein
MMPIALPTLVSNERNRNLAVHALRSEALNRLYARRRTIESLIQSLEDYAECKQSGPNLVEFINAERKCS